MTTFKDLPIGARFKIAAYFWCKINETHATPSGAYMPTPFSPDTKVVTAKVRRPKS